MLIEIVSIVFAIYQIVVFTSLYVILCGYQLIPTESQNLFSAKNILLPILTSCFSVIHRVCLQPVMVCFSYLLLLFFEPNPIFAEYKDISSTFITANSDIHYVLFALISVCLVENIFLNLIQILFFTDFTLLKIYIWSTNDWQNPLLELIMKLYVSGIFIFDSNDSVLTPTSFVACLGYLALIFIRFYRVVSHYPWADVTELFYESMTASLYAFILAEQVFYHTI